MFLVFDLKGKVWRFLGTHEPYYSSYRYMFVGIAYQGKDIVFRFIIEYSSLMDFGP
jgi:hypothetical protein